MKLETTDYFYILRYNEQERLIDIILEIHYRIKSSFKIMLNHSQRYREIIASIYLDNIDNIDCSNFLFGEYIRFEDCEDIQHINNPVKACKLWQQKVNKVFKTTSKLNFYHTDTRGSHDYIPQQGKGYIDRKPL